MSAFVELGERMWRGRFTEKVRCRPSDLACSRDLRRGETDVKRTATYTDALLRRNR